MILTHPCLVVLAGLISIGAAHGDPEAARAAHERAMHAAPEPAAMSGEEVGRARLVDREMTILAATLNGNVSVGKHVFERPEIRFAEGFPVADVGHRILKDFVVTLDFENRRIRLERSAAPSAGS